MINALKLVVSCEALGLEKSFLGTSFGHVFKKACQYVMTNEKVCRILKHFFIKSTQGDLQNYITLPIWEGKVRVEYTLCWFWNSHKETSLFLFCKFINKVTMFQ
jgi:hypothetical protein